MSDAKRLATADDEELLRDMSERATLLYWNSDQSVNSIAEDLGLSKGRLYDLIRPLASGLPCPNCQSDLVFRNRTARDRGDAVCLVCEEGADPLQDNAAVPTTTARGLPTGSLERGGLLAGFLIGTVTGVLLGRFLRR